MGVKSRSVVSGSAARYFFRMGKPWLRATFLGSLLASLTPLTMPAHGQGGPSWELVDDAGGIRVWSLDIPGRDLPGFRGITSIDAGLDEVFSFMLEVSRHTEWQYHCDESRLVKRYTETHGVLYNRINAPWPIKDRDVVLDIAYRFTPQHNAVTFRFRTTQDGGVPVPWRVVRIPRLEGFFRLWQETPTRTHVLYQVEVDIGGNVPDGAARRYARKLPYETLENLRSLVERRAVSPEIRLP